MLSTSMIARLVPDEQHYAQHGYSFSESKPARRDESRRIGGKLG